jgi:hypothetical protein
MQRFMSTRLSTFVAYEDIDKRLDGENKAR